MWRIKSEGNKRSRDFAVKNFCDDLIGIYRQNGLRSMAQNGVLTLEEESKLEEWLFRRCELDRDVIDSYHQSRQQWHLDLQEKAGNKVLKTDNVEFLINKLHEVAQSNDLPDSTIVFDQLPLRERTYYFSTLCGVFKTHHLIDRAKSVLNQLKNEIVTSRLNADEKSILLCDIILDYVDLGDKTGLGDTLHKIDEAGYIQLCHDLGVSPDQFVDLFYFCSIGQMSYKFKDPSSSDFRQLMRLSHKSHPFTDDGRVYHAMMYVDLLSARILAYGEAGIKYPSPDEYRSSYDVCANMAIFYGLMGDEQSFALWLKRLYEKANGNSYVKLVYDQIKELSGN